MTKMRIHLYKLIALFALCLGAPLHTSAQIDIWQDVPGHKKVWLTPYTLPGSGHMAVIVCPGGSYYWHGMTAEGEETALWLRSHGIAAFVLRYRTAYVPAFLFRYRYILRGNRYPDPQDDLRQAMAYLRSHADSLGIDSHKIGAIGFSAGGHLVMSAVELFPRSEWPCFVAPIYAVITMHPPYAHKRSRRGLLGESQMNNQAMRDSLSLERHVPKDCPPVFIANCKDDPTVDWHNSVLLDSALTSKGIAHEYHQYLTGGHGFGASDRRGTAECRQWKQAFISWLHNLFPDKVNLHPETQYGREDR